MPDSLIEDAVKCISTGIGEPLLSNDDRVIPALIKYGYSELDAYDYVTSACWEPLILGNACEPNNVASLNFYVPMIKIFNNITMLDEIVDMESLLQAYSKYLKDYINNTLKECDKLVYDNDSLLSLFSDSSLKSRCDFIKGGAIYYNRGLTGVGMSSTINSIINIE